MLTFKVCLQSSHYLMKLRSCESEILSWCGAGSVDTISPSIFRIQKETYCQWYRVPKIITQLPYLKPDWGKKKKKGKYKK